MRNKTGNLIKFKVMILAIALIVQLWPAGAVQAQVDCTQVPTPAGCTGFERICSRDLGLAGCIAKIYLFSLGAAALIALLMIILAGYRYMTAAGNAEAVSSAKESMDVAFRGVIIIFIGFVLLYLINPDLVQFKKTLFPPLRDDGGPSLNP